MLHLGIIRKIAVRGWVPDSDGAKILRTRISCINFHAQKKLMPDSNELK